MQEKIVKLTKTELNELLNTMKEDEPNYGLILKLQYIYGRNISEVYSLTKTDINQDENTITFIMNGDKLTYKVHNEIKEQLYEVVENSDKQYIFQEGDRPLSNVKDGINYYLHKKTDALNELPFLEGLRLTTKDFKALRGQHLYQDGVPIKLIHELYHNTNTDGTKKTIRYDELNELLYSESVESIIDDTCLQVFTDHTFNRNPLYYITDKEGKESILEIKDDTLNFYGNEDLREVFNDLNSEELLKLLNHVQSPGDYVYYNNLKFLKN